MASTMIGGVTLQAGQSITLGYPITFGRPSQQRLATIHSYKVECAVCETVYEIQGEPWNRTSVTCSPECQRALDVQERLNPSMAADSSQGYT